MMTLPVDLSPMTQSKNVSVPNYNQKQVNSQLAPKSVAVLNSQID